MPYKLKRRGNDLEIHDHPDGTCETFDQVKKLILNQAEEFDVEKVYMISTDGHKTSVDWRGFIKGAPVIDELKSAADKMLASCSDCKGLVSLHAQSCPHCGAKREPGVTINGKLTTCPDCHGSVSVYAKTCPHCGAKRRKKRSGCTVISIIGLLLLAVGYTAYQYKPNLKEDVDQLEVFGIPVNDKINSIKAEITNVIENFSSELKTSHIDMSYQRCLAATGPALTKLKIPDSDIVSIVNTDSIRRTLICSANGSGMLLTCDKTGMTINSSSDKKKIGCPD